MLQAGKINPMLKKIIHWIILAAGHLFWLFFFAWAIYSFFIFPKEIKSIDLNNGFTVRYKTIDSDAALYDGENKIIPGVMEIGGCGNYIYGRTHKNETGKCFAYDAKNKVLESEAADCSLFGITHGLKNIKWQYHGDTRRVFSKKCRK